MGLNLILRARRRSPVQIRSQKHFKFRDKFIDIQVVGKDWRIELQTLR